MSALVVIGCGASSIDAIRAADSLPANWALAAARGIGGERVIEIADGLRPVEAEEWCVVVADDVDASDLDRDPAVATYERIPEDSVALAAWRAS